MAYNKKYAELGESVIDYVNDREDRIEGAFDEINNKIVFSHGNEATLGGGGTIVFPAGREVLNFYTEGPGDSGIDYIYIGWDLKYQVSNNRYVAYLYDRRNGTGLLMGMRIPYSYTYIKD